MKISEELRQMFWDLITPLFPFMRDTCLALGIVHHNGRQDHLLGWLKKGKTLQELKNYLIKLGFRNNIIAWRDDGELYGLRLRINFARQYHIRIFEDGEIKGHFEFTPESHPVLHFRDQGMEARTKEFHELLDGWVRKPRTLGKIISQRKPATSLASPSKG